jgi:murein DD-endopeptidase MepM/ murein hydrolase activator NlpD
VTGDATADLVAAAQRYGVDPSALLAVASVEGGTTYGAIGDHGTSYGPLQLHRGGALPAGRGAAWANSPAGIDYAVSRIAKYAKGLRGKAAVAAIVRGFERPANPTAEIAKANAQLAKGQRLTLAQLLAKIRSAIIGVPYVGTHTLYGNWESDNAIDIKEPIGTPIYAPAAGVIGQQIGPLNSTDPHLLGNRLHLQLSGGNELYFAHLSKLTVQAGQHVKAGQLLGYSGSANGVAHLHLAEKAQNTGSGSSSLGTLEKFAAFSINPIGGVGNLLLGGAGAAKDAAGSALGGIDAVGEVASGFLNDPAYPFLWLLFVMAGVGLIVLGLVRLAPDSAKQQAKQLAILGAMA